MVGPDGTKPICLASCLESEMILKSKPTTEERTVFCQKKPGRSQEIVRAHCRQQMVGSGATPAAVTCSEEFPFRSRCGCARRELHHPRPLRPPARLAAVPR